MTDRSTGPRCGNNPNVQLTPGDRKAVADFKARLALRASAKPYIDSAAWVDGDPLMETIAVTVWERCARDDADMPQLVCDDPRTIAAFAAAVVQAHREGQTRADQAALERVRTVLETEAVVGRSALEYRGLITSALMADEAQQPVALTVAYSGKGRAFCVTCPRPDDEDVPLTIAEIGLNECCTACGRGLRDVAEAQQQTDTETQPTTAPDAKPVCICGHPVILHHEDVCLRADCACADVLEIGALPDALAAVLTKRFTELGNQFAEMRVHEQGPDGWPSSRLVSPHMVAEVLGELLRLTAAGARQGGAQTQEANVYLSTRCDACRHTLNWHRNGVGCTVALCVCGSFQAPVEELPK